MRHPFHSICPYFAMFPEHFVRDQLFAYSRPGDLVLDPFSGRGTTLFESVLNNRTSIGTDINPVAACISGAKVSPPKSKTVFSRLSNLESTFREVGDTLKSPSPFFDACFDRYTLRQILFLRSELKWRRSKVDRFIAAMMLGALHGESHRTELCLSNRMPRTISTKPDYSVRWWQSKGLVAPKRDAFAILRRLTTFRFSQAVPTTGGAVRLADARKCSDLFAKQLGKVRLMVTSPPYIDTTDYSEDQWLRLWFLGGEPFPQARLNKDDRYTNPDDYWDFLEEVWCGCSELMARKSTIVIRIGGKAAGEELFEGVSQTLREGLRGSGLKVREKYQYASLIRRRQTNVFRPGTSNDRHEFDFTFEIL